MYVQCDRCKSEYEFDDALVSERGTTVKCTHCAHQFKVRPNADHGALDRWVVKTVSGRDVVFTSLRELQKAIVAGQLSVHDSLARAGAAARLLGAIPELSPFFAGKKTIEGSAGQPNMPASPADRPRVPTLRPPPGSGVPAQASAGQSRELSPRAQTLGGAPVKLPSAPPPPLPPQALPTTRLISVSAPEAPSDAPTLARSSDLGFQATHRHIEMSSPLPPAVRRDASLDDQALPPRSSLAEEVYGRPRRGLGGWVIAAVLLLGTAVGAAVVAKPYLSSGPQKSVASAAAPLNEKAQQYVVEGDRAMLEGNLAAAKQAFDKASGSAEKDPRVLLRSARVAVALADEAWLDAKIQGDADGERSAKRRLDEAAASAAGAASELLVATPDDAEAIRLKLDSLRVEGKVGDARALVVRIAGGAPQPDTAYALAMLDLAETQPPAQYTEVLDRLRLAAASEGKLGRGRGALIYALCRAGDTVQARNQLAQLADLPRQPLMASLKAFIDRVRPAVDGGTLASAATGSGPPASGGNPSGAVAAAGANGGGTAGASGGDPRALLIQADAAKRKGDLDRASLLYESVVAAEPANSEALAGLGEIAERKHDFASAKANYKSALTANPGYLPARLGYANVLWQSGDKSAAQKGYADIVDSLPDSAYPSYVKERAQGSAAPTPAPPAPAVVPSPSDDPPAGAAP